MSGSRRDEGRAAVEARRREVEDRLGALRAAIADETGFAPRRKGILTGLIAATVGLAIARRRRPRALDEGEDLRDDTRDREPDPGSRE